MHGENHSVKLIYSSSYRNAQTASGLKYVWSSN